MKKIYTVLFALIFSVLPLSGGISSAIASTNQEISDSLFALVNAERVSAGLPALITNPLLVKAAEAKAQDMMAQGYFEHTNPQGKQFYLWIDEAGYTGYTIAGENLAANINMISPGKMVESWLNSPLHRANLLSDKFTETGIASLSGTFEGKPTVFAVQVFAHPKIPAPVMQIMAPINIVTSAPNPKVQIVPVVPVLQTNAKVPAKPKTSTPLEVKTIKKPVEETIIKGVTLDSTSTPESHLALVKAERLEKSGMWTTFISKVIELIHAIL